MDLAAVAFASIIVLGILSGIGAYIAAQKNRSGIEGAVFGFLLGPFGLLIVALLPTKSQPRRHPAMLDRAVSVFPDFPGLEPALQPARHDPDEDAAFAAINGAVLPKSHRWDGDTVHWTCECGRERKAERRLAGRIAPCPTCKVRTVVPG